MTSYSDIPVNKLLLIFGGLAGYAVSLVSCCSLVLIQFGSDQLAAESPYAIISFLEISLLLSLGKHASDFFHQTTGFHTLVIISLLAIVGILLTSNAYDFALLIHASLIAVAGCAFLFIWTPFLSIVPRRPLLIIIAATFALLGVLFFCISLCSAQVFFITIVFSATISSICAVISKSKLDVNVESVSASISKQRVETKRHGTLSSLFLTGFACGASGCTMFFVAQTLGQALFAMGVAFIVSSALSIVFRYRFEYQFETILRRFFSILLSAGFMAIPFIEPQYQVICCTFTLSISLCLFMVVFGAIAETARFISISAIWLMGLEGCIIAGGLTLGTLFLWWGLGISPIPLAPVISCLGFVFVISILQMFISEKRYLVPEELVYEQVRKSKTEETQETIESDLVESADYTKNVSWRKKIDALAEIYDLTPRQKQIVDLYAKGRSMGFIADDFVVSISTIKTHIYHTYQKLNVHTRQELLNLIESMSISKK